MSTIRQPLQVALHQELRRIDRFIARIWVVLYGVGVLLSLVVAATISRGLGLTMSAMATVMLVMFLVAERALLRRPLGKRTPLAVVVAEGLTPWAFFAAIFYTQGAAYALASWVPPLLFAALIVAWVARLEPAAPIVLGVSSAVMFLGVYFAVVYANVPHGPAHQILYDPPMQLSRAFSFVVGGTLGSFVARALRRAIGRADETVRREELFGKYRLLRKIGAGSGGSVHEAVYCPEGGFERRVAVKQLHPSLISEPSFVEGFRAEAELGARLAHPNVVTIHDFGRHQETYFMAMEYVDGLPLSKLAVRARAAGVLLSPAIVGHIGRSVLSALDHAHHGVHDATGKPIHVLHRDVCPQNLLVSRIGEVKLTDFGIARVLGQAGENASTRTIAGHEAYMAPEQIEGRASLSSDLFAVGIVMWELLADKRLFARDNPAATLLAVVAGAVPHVTTTRARLDPAWDAFFVSALARRAEDRFASAHVMLAALDAIPSARGDDAQSELGALVGKLSGEVTKSTAAIEADTRPTIREELSA